jgi:hypothetical protein
MRRCLVVRNWPDTALLAGWSGRPRLRNKDDVRLGRSRPVLRLSGSMRRCLVVRNWPDTALLAGWSGRPRLRNKDDVRLGRSNAHCHRVAEIERPAGIRLRLNQDRSTSSHRLRSPPARHANERQPLAWQRALPIFCQKLRRQNVLIEYRWAETLSRLNYAQSLNSRGSSRRSASMRATNSI